jgi:hypothetical protein
MHTLPCNWDKWCMGAHVTPIRGAHKKQTDELRSPVSLMRFNWRLLELWVREFLVLARHLVFSMNAFRRLDLLPFSGKIVDVISARLDPLVS